MAKATFTLRGGASEYDTPNFRAPLRLEGARASIPAHATVKGFYLRALVRELAQNGHPMPELGPYREFGDYSMLETANLLVTCAERLHGGAPLREGLRRVGWIIFPTLLSTMVGRVIFGALGNDIVAVAKHASRGFEVSLSAGRCVPLRITQTESELRVTGWHLFADCFLVGVFEGVLAHYGYDADVLIRVSSPTDADYFIKWG